MSLVPSALEAVLQYPQIDPVALQLGPLAIRWYGLAYITGLVLGWWAILGMLREASLWTDPPFNGRRPASPDQIGDLVVWATLGVVLGGRLGWVLFYGIALCSVSQGTAYCHGLPMAFLTDPVRIVAAWDGGMSFHGGLFGVALALWLFCRKHKLEVLQVSDLAAVVAPIGLFFGRIANFVNGELWGKPTNAPWAMIFPRSGDGLPRHPSQLYEAGLEGILLFAILQVGLRVFRWHRRPGLLSAMFFAGYGLFRFFVEFFREPDAPFIGWFSMGMALSIPLWLAAAYLFWTSLHMPMKARAR